MGRLLRFFLVLNMWLGFNYGVIINLYHSLPKIDRPLFIFVYITLIVIPPAVFYAYLTFIYEKDYIHAYELKKFINKKLHLNRVLLNALMTGAGIIYRCGGNLSPEFNDRLNLLKSQIHIGHDQEIFLSKVYLDGQETNFPIKEFLRNLSLLQKKHGPHFSAWMFLAWIKLLEVSDRKITYPQSLLKALERLRTALKLRQDVYYLLETNFLLFDSELKSNFTNYSKYTYFYSGSEFNTEEQQLQEAYKTLELPINASPEDVHRQYRKLVFKFHPDRLSIEQQNEQNLKLAKEKLQKIHTAYHFICKYQKKKNG